MITRSKKLWSHVTFPSAALPQALRAALSHRRIMLNRFSVCMAAEMPHDAHGS
jgi:hypothetical protein